MTAYRTPVDPPETESDMHQMFLGPQRACPWCNDCLFIHRTMCTPTSRKRHGFLWLKKCNIAGTHAHCSHAHRCGGEWIERIEADGKRVVNVRVQR